ncbi:hypothetical protein TTRE_0000380901 [Trichuris trichiura]|uniref:Uncharacterized protein n=1 Tax=Trichuris trichiura TaxID=36087 RepID=A0A077Z4W2_TRITR|nr:hypothetical protein TTRE_0000380901 [Trichuris trichiura]
MRADAVQVVRIDCFAWRSPSAALVTALVQDMSRMNDINGCGSLLLASDDDPAARISDLAVCLRKGGGGGLQHPSALTISMIFKRHVRSGHQATRNEETLRLQCLEKGFIFIHICNQIVRSFCDYGRPGSSSVCALPGASIGRDFWSSTERYVKGIERAGKQQGGTWK